MTKWEEKTDLGSSPSWSEPRRWAISWARRRGIRISWFPEKVVSYPTRWSLYSSLDFCVDHLTSSEQRDIVQLCTTEKGTSSHIKKSWNFWTKPKLGQASKNSYEHFFNSWFSQRINTYVHDFDLGTIFISKTFQMTYYQILLTKVSFSISSIKHKKNNVLLLEKVNTIGWIAWLEVGGRGPQ